LDKSDEYEGIVRTQEERESDIERFIRDMNQWEVFMMIEYFRGNKELVYENVQTYTEFTVFQPLAQLN